jgi:serine/threonine-protein kinase RsbW
MQKTFKRSFESLEEIFHFTEGFFSRERLDRQHLFAVNLAVEELFTNMVKYNAGSAAEILLELEKTDDQLRVSLTDMDADPFDVTAVDEPQVDLPLQHRDPGGLGLLLARKFMDQVDYHYTNRQSKITMIKGLGQDDD